jgi:hypothetical protein
MKNGRTVGGVACTPKDHTLKEITLIYTNFQKNIFFENDSHYVPDRLRILKQDIELVCIVFL